MSPATLLATHTTQIAHLARTHAKPWQPLAGVEDLAQVGWVALLECQRRHNPARARLQSYAERRMAGAMVDEQRRLDPRTRYAQQHGVPPVALLPLREAAALWAPRDAAPEPFLAARVAQLPARLQQILRLSYVEGWWLGEIAAAWGVTEGRISQLRTRAVQLLRQALEEQP